MANSVEHCWNQIKKSKKIAIICHRSCDMDAIGSSIALKRLVENNFSTPKMPVLVDIFTDTPTIKKKNPDENKYAMFVKGESINIKHSKTYDLAIALDTSAPTLLGKFAKIFKNAKDTLNIDHHQSNTLFAKNNIVLPNCSSTAEVLYLLFIKLEKLNYTSDILRLIYAGIVTDTNNLRQNIGDHTMRVVDEISHSNLQEMKNLSTIRDYFFRNETKERIALLTKALSSISFSDDGKIAMMKIVKQDFAETGTSIEDTFGIVDYSTMIQGVEIGCIFIKQDDNTYYVSLRSKSNIDVGSIAQEMGGGGHKNVAAFQTSQNDNLTDIKAKLIAICNTKLCESLPVENLENLFARIKFAPTKVKTKYGSSKSKSKSKKQE